MLETARALLVVERSPEIQGAEMEQAEIGDYVKRIPGVYYLHAVTLARIAGCTIAEARMWLENNKIVPPVIKRDERTGERLS